jgi:hypothetical protein
MKQRLATGKNRSVKPQSLGFSYGCPQEINIYQVAGFRIAAQVFRVHPAVAALEVAAVGEIELKRAQRRDALGKASIFFGLMPVLTAD